jgi:hypothetical protein
MAVGDDLRALRLARLEERPQIAAEAGIVAAL